MQFPLPVYAHTLPSAPQDDWEPLYGPCGHAQKVTDILLGFSNPFEKDVLADISPLFRALGRYHDMGKASSDFQRYLVCSASGKHPAKVDHKTAAACFVTQGHPEMINKVLAYAFAGHHSGLPRGTDLFPAALKRFAMPDEIMKALPSAWQTLPGLASPRLGLRMKTPQEVAFALQMAVRMLHSCLIDADWLATESFMEPETYRRRVACRGASMPSLSARTEEYIARREKTASGHIAALRRAIHAACYASAEKAPGVYRLNVPTGGGKTLSSLSFALAHAARHGMERVIYVIPYTSITDQTAREFREVLGEENLVEHHSNISEENDTSRNRFAAENWDVPLVVTTGVQFFETLFSSRNNRCRKLHRIAHSVIIFDEAQCLPAKLLAPCLLAMKTLQRHYGCTLVLCTATQPALAYRERFFEIGWPREEMRSLIGETFEQRLAQEMKRVELQRLGRLSQEALLDHFLSNGKGSALFIVNLTGQAQDLYEALKKRETEGLFHLSARMCPAHRANVLEDVRKRLKEGLPTVLVSTRVVEAGVDVSFPVVYRDQCGLDSLAQSAGRCNRHGEAAVGHVYAYEAEDVALPQSFVDLRRGIEAFQDTMECLPGRDPFAPETVEKYFRLFYSKCKGRMKPWDDAGVLSLVGERGSMVEAWDFPEMAERFRWIPEEQRSLLIPYNEEARALRDALAEAARAGRMPRREDFRRAQQFSVSVYEQEWESLSSRRELVHEEAGIWMLTDAEAYSAGVGLLKHRGELDYIV